MKLLCNSSQHCIYIFIMRESNDPHSETVCFVEHIFGETIELLHAYIY